MKKIEAPLAYTHGIFPSTSSELKSAGAENSAIHPRTYIRGFPRRRIDWLPIWLIFVAAGYLIPWWNKVYFLWDDIELLMRLRHPALETFLTSHQYQFFPVFKLFYWLEIQLFGVNPAAFFAISVALHLINIYLAYSLIKKLTSSQTLSLLAAILVSFNKSFFTVIFWPTIQSNLLLTTFMLISFHLFFSLQNRFRKTGLFLLTSSILLAGLSFGFGVGSGFVFAGVAWAFWKKSPGRAAVIAAGLATGIASVAAILLLSTAEIQKDNIFQLSPIRIFNITYFTLVGLSQGTIGRFLLPGFIPNIYSPANVVVMIALPAAALIFFLKTIIAYRKQLSTLAPLALFLSFTAAPYFIAALARSGPGALGGLAERYIYPPFFSFVVSLVYCFHLISKNRKFPVFLTKLILPGATIILTVGHQLAMHFEVSRLFLP
jgi:hypothetical protein